MGDKRRDLGHRCARTPHKSKTSSARSSRRPQTEPGDLLATNLAATVPSETADSDRKPENACSRSHNYSFTLDRKALAVIYLRHALWLSPFLLLRFVVLSD